MQEYHNFINGKFVPSSGKIRIEVTNPSTGQAICTVPESSEADLELALQCLTAERAARSPDALHDLLRRLSDLSADGWPPASPSRPPPGSG